MIVGLCVGEIHDAVLTSGWLSAVDTFSKTPVSSADRTLAHE